MENFIYQQYLSDLSICDKLIAHHTSDETKSYGQLYDGKGESHVQPDKKFSVDSRLEPHDPMFVEYAKYLQEVVDAYIAKFPWCNEYSPWGVVDLTNIQYYPPGAGGFKAWHTERGGRYGNMVSRHLVFMTYLNDVTDGGETEFFHQKLKVSPKKGLTLIWPVDWTYTHRGLVSPTEDKYVITGWFNFM